MLSDGDRLQRNTVPKSRGTCLLTSHYRHWYAFGRTLWARPRWGVLSSAVFQSEITSFVVDSSRSRKMILLNDVSGRLVFKNAERLGRARRGDNVGFALMATAWPAPSTPIQAGEKPVPSVRDRQSKNGKLWAMDGWLGLREFGCLCRFPTAPLAKPRWHGVR